MVIERHRNSGASMEIHKPKAAHSWREFLTEIGTITCGILIALGLEQAVEQVHWRDEVETEREALRDEAAEAVTTAAYRVAMEPCIAHRLAEIETGFRRQARGQSLGFRQPVTGPPAWNASTGSWEIALSGQALAHMPHKEKLAFSDAFDTYKAFDELRNEEGAVWRRLSLINHPDILAPGDWVELHQAYGQALGMNDRMKTITQYILEQATLGHRPEKFEGIDQGRLAAFCTSIL